jgi:hypothetical protein
MFFDVTLRDMFVVSYLIGLLFGYVKLKQYFTPKLR